MLALAEQYAALKGAAILAHKIEGKEITFVLSTGPKLTMTESQLKLAIENLSKKTDSAGTVADGEPTPPPALDGTAQSADKPKSKRKEK